MARQVTRVPQAPQAQMDYKAQQEFRVYKELQVPMAPPELPGPQVPLVHKAQRAYKVYRE